MIYVIFFLGNKDFVIEFLRRGYSVVCVYLCGLSGTNCPGENKHPSPESQLAYYPDSSSVLLVSVNKHIIRSLS